MAKKKKQKSYAYVYVIAIILAVLGFAAYKIFGPNTGNFTKGSYLYVHTKSDFKQLMQNIAEGGFVNDVSTFEFLAKQAQVPNHIHPGKYLIKGGMSNYQIIRLLRSGKQVPIKLVINKIRTLHDFVSLVATNLECDSNELSNLLEDETYLKKFGFTPHTVICALFPDTYDFYWNTNADKAFRKIEKNYARFWDAQHRKKAEALGLDPIRVTTLASIVEEETNVVADKPTIASVYLNRLKKGMKLQADPTVKYAVGDFTIKRIAGKMMNDPSPYNTYRYEGLPPGPICTPSVSSINAVLDAPTTTYLYFCASADFSGASVFATTFDQQKKNATAYWKALNAHGIH